MSETAVLVDGLIFPESPRWHEGRLWLSRAAAVMDSHAEAASRTRGGNTFAWLLTYRSYASTQARPRQATAWAVEGALAADRAGVPLAMVAALEVLAVACMRAGLTAEGAAVSGYLDLLPSDLGIPTTTTLAAQRRTAIGALDGPPHQDVPANRTQLLALLRRIGHAVA